MNAQTSPVRVLTPIQQLPAEGYESEASEPNPSPAPLDLYVAALAQSEIGFEVTGDGAKPNRPTVQDVFQRFDLDGNGLQPTDEAVEIDFEQLLANRGTWDDLNDASEPKDYVRRFLETLGPALDDQSEIEFEGRHVPLIRWTERKGEGANVQLLGVLQADEETFEGFCRSNADDFDFNLILEDAEVEAHGLREIATSIVILGVSLGVIPSAEAGIFDRIFEPTADQSDLRTLDGRKAVRKTRARVVRSEGGWVDTHNDALIDRSYLQSTAGKDAKRRVVVDIENQRAYLIINGRIAIDTPVSTARSDKFTPRGEFKITERIRTGKISTLYGCELPYWMRLDSSAIGMHIGDLPGKPASAGCIRLPFSIAPFMFDNTGSGTVVEVVESWDPDSIQQAPVMLAQVN
ncbi:MAG: lipoprotein-anchoring transpeptidase ErfK/SrfK [Verrucomicrobiales bacterium]|jgi:lipoprotein-anchoring transpeptidase ErfK/SrfK